MQQTDELLEAIEQYLAGNATAAQRQLVNQWYHSFDDELVTVETGEVGFEELLEARLKLRLAESTGIGVAGKTEVKRVRLWPRIAVAAAAVAAITLGTWIYMNMSPDVKSGGEVVRNDIAPGKNGATITLASGKVIELDSAKNGVIVGDGKLAYYSSLRGGTTKQSPLHDEIASIPRNDGEGKQQITASTAKGQTYQFTLPDGSKVWLNADSKLEFPSSFVNSNTRNVKLTGEGYFEVAKDKAHPFMVETDQQIVEVLGTHFNINSYKDEGAVRTTLLEGSVRISRHLDTETSSAQARDLLNSTNKRSLPAVRDDVTLKPSQQSVVSGSNRISVKEIDPAEAIAWKNGLFVFDNETLESIMQRVARWYDVEVNYEADASLKESTFSGTISRFSNISKVLERLERTGIVKFELNGKQLKVKK